MSSSEYPIRALSLLTITDYDIQTSPLSSNCWLLVFNQLECVEDFVALASTCKATYHVTQATRYSDVWISLGRSVITPSFSCARDGSSGTARSTFIECYLTPRWLSPPDGYTVCQTTIGRGSILNFGQSDVTAVVNRPFRPNEICYWELLQTGRNGSRLGLSDCGEVCFSDLWQTGWAILVGGETYIKGRSIRDDTAWVAPFRDAAPVLTVPPHATGSYESGRGYENRLVGFRYDGSRNSLDLYCNRVFVCCLFDGDLPQPMWAAVSNGTGTTSLQARFFGPIVPAPLEGLDEYLLLYEDSLDGLL